MLKRLFSNKFVTESGEYGTYLVLDGPWNDTYIDVINENNFTGLICNYAKGWKGENLNFLSRLNGLKYFSITDWKIEDVSPIHNLSNLQFIEVNTYCKTAIDFSAFPTLQECCIEWRAKAKTVFDCKSLRKLFVNSYKGKRSEPFTKLTRLESLSIANSSLEDIESFANLTGLVFLGLYNLKKLHFLNGIESLLNLERLEINGCRKISNIDLLTGLIKIKSLHLCDDGDIDSIFPVSNLSYLEEFLFYDNTNIVDGDLSCLKKLPRLTNVSFQDRKHYSHNRDSFVNK